MQVVVVVLRDLQLYPRHLRLLREEVVHVGLHRLVELGDLLLVLLLRVVLRRVLTLERPVLRLGISGWDHWHLRWGHRVPGRLLGSALGAKRHLVASLILLRISVGLNVARHVIRRHHCYRLVVSTGLALNRNHRPYHRLLIILTIVLSPVLAKISMVLLLGRI